MRHVDDGEVRSGLGRRGVFRRWIANRRNDLRSVRRGRLSMICLAAVLITCATASVLYVAVVTGGMNGMDISAVPQMKETTRVYDRSGGLIYEFYEKKRTVVPLSHMAPRVLQAMVSIEDRNFYHHSGFDPKAIARAALANLQSRRITQGASTITQQLARNTFLSQERSLRRKLQELWLALKIEHAYTKDQILEFYANRVYLGSGFYGVEAAAQGYFGKPASDLSLPEAALLAGIIRAPAQYSPYRDLTKALQRRKVVLDAMVQCGYVSAGDAKEAVREVPQVHPRSDDLANSSYAVDYIRQVMTDRFGYEATFNGGLRVYTSLDSTMQAAAEDAINSQLSRLDKQRAKSSRRAPSIPPEELQGALLSINASTGEIYALVGGRSYSESKFDRAIDARRQPGSAFKPIVYAAALEAGMTPATLIDAQASIFGTPQGPYLPANDGEQEFGRMTLRHALRNSVNTAAVQVGQVVGLRNVIRCAHDFGISGNLPEVLSLPLGAGEVTLLDLVRAYTAFPNGGRTTLPHIIVRVESASGKTVFSARPQHRTAIDEQTAFLMTSMLSDVVDHGTAYGIRAAGYSGPVAGKTGTTNDFRDAWFVGFTPEVVTGVWVGYDKPQAISNSGYGATVALPVWIRFMKAAFPKPLSPSFAKSPGIVQKEVCAESGQLATAYCRSQWRPSSDNSGPDVDPAPSTYTEYFSGRNLPPSCQLHSSLTSVTSDTSGSEVTISPGSSP